MVKKQEKVQKIQMEIKDKFFIPFKSIGVFILNSDINKYLKNYIYEYTEVDEITGWDTYNIIGLNISLFTDSGKIVSMLCENECYYNNKNIIGVNIDDFMNFNNLQYTNEESLFVNNNEKQNVYEFDSIGLQVWCKKNEIVTVIACDNSL